MEVPFMVKKRWNIAAFVAYGTIMLWLLFYRSLPDTGSPGFSHWSWVQENSNFVPFHTIRLFWNVLADPQSYIDRMGIAWYEANRQHAIINLGGNVLMFLPLGFFPPRISTRFRTWWKTLVVAMIIITTVELTQALTLRGNCDVDDLMLNLLGTAIGYGIFTLTKQT